ncbi:MAG TPA: hypothetical protein VEF06_00185 [Bryobacteraceae bacterium]|nr:hypothetical protein [Bryobacteraceae bacterium]
MASKSAMAPSMDVSTAAALARLVIELSKIGLMMRPAWAGSAAAPSSRMNPR